MTAEIVDPVVSRLLSSIPRDLILGVEDGLDAGARRAYRAAAGMHQGHLPSVLGQLRHFHMNEAYSEALAAAQVSATPLRGNAVVVGTSGLVKLGRFNLPSGVWNHARRSKSRLVMARANSAVETNIFSDIFGYSEQVTTLTAFFVTVFSGSIKVQPEYPISIEIAIPDSQMKGWLFRESLTKFVKRYDTAVSLEQPDRAKPVLKVERDVGRP